VVESLAVTLISVTCPSLQEKYTATLATTKIKKHKWSNHEIVAISVKFRIIAVPGTKGTPGVRNELVSSHISFPRSFIASMTSEEQMRHKHPVTNMGMLHS